jgi:hypothetical protein
MMPEKQNTPCKRSYSYKAKILDTRNCCQNFKNHFNSSIENKNIEELKSKPMHRQFYQDLETLSVDREKSLAWLCTSSLKGETESLAITA